MDKRRLSVQSIAEIITQIESMKTSKFARCREKNLGRGRGRPRENLGLKGLREVAKSF